MELKPYQARVIQDLDTYLTLVDQTQDYAKAYTQFWNEKGIAVGKTDSKSMPAYKDIVSWCPHVTIKVPTAGGKTFIATNAIKTIIDHLDPLKSKVVVWLVPSITILDQTIINLNNPEHPYRQKLDMLFQNRVSIYTKEQVLQGASFSLDAIQSQLNIIVMSYDTFRSKSKDNRKIYEDNGNLTSFESVVQSGIDGTNDVVSAMNVLHNLRPIVIVDEAHNTTSDLSVDMLINLNPCCVFDLTATPRDNANIICYVSALELKKEEMVKLPVVAYNQQSLDEVITNAVHFQHELELLAQTNQSQGWEYIRPIVLFQAQPKWWDDEGNFHKIKEKLIKKGILEEQIKIKTATINEIKNVNLLSQDCPVRYIITINALKEWWDCPFAYILASLANKSSEIDVTQILGRILRQPFAHKTKQELLDCSYVFTASDKFHEVLKKIVLSLNAWWYNNKLYYKDKELTDEALVIGVDMAPTGEPLFSETSITPEDVLEEISDTPIASVESSTNVAKSIADQASSQIQAFTQAVNDIDLDMSEFMSPEESEKKNFFNMKEQYISANKFLLPQFVINRKDTGLFTETDGTKLVEKEDCLTDFQLHTQPTDISFDDVDNSVFVVDVHESWVNQFAPESSKLNSKSTQKFMSYIAHQTDEVALKSVANLALVDLKKFDHLNEKELKNYVMRVLESLTSDQIADLKNNPFKYSSKIKQKIDQLQQTHMMKQFIKQLDVGSITLAPLFELPRSINLLETTSGITKSLYTEEWSMNGFENKAILAIANLESVERRHRNIERRWFFLNGWINTYPDFIIKMKSGKIILIETKWDDRDNSDSKAKVALWQYWANKAWDNYRYMMIFDNNKIDGAFNFDDGIDRLKNL